LELLQIVGKALAVAIQNALLYEKIQHFNATLQERVQKATRELKHTNDKLRALDETKDEFITMASHQLRTPLTSVKGYLSMVLEGDAGKLNAGQRKLLEQSYASSQRMVYLIADLLNLSRLATGKFVIDATPTDLAEVVQTEVDQLVETARSREITLEFKRPTDFPELLLDETKIHQVVMNFIDNAIYYTPPGGTVTVELKDDGANVEYLVKDTGIGVPRSEQHKLFSKFYRAGNARKARPDGTGLGLFMAKKVVVAQGGAIIFESEEGKGSTFGFRFSKHTHALPVAKPLVETAA
jgi:signal transduction histidine kinase